MKEIIKLLLDDPIMCMSLNALVLILAITLAVSFNRVISHYFPVPEPAAITTQLK